MEEKPFSLSNPSHEISLLKSLERNARLAGNLSDEDDFKARIKSLSQIDESKVICPYDDIEVAKSIIGRGLKVEFTKPAQ